jgi:hypothetical protein
MFLIEIRQYDTTYAKPDLAMFQVWSPAANRHAAGLRAGGFLLAAHGQKEFSVSDFSYFQPSEHVHIENAPPAPERYLNDAAIAKEQGGGGLFWELVAGLVPGRPGKPQAPRSYQRRQLPLDVQIDAVSRRDAAIARLNAAPGTLAAVVGQVIEETSEAVKATVRKLTKTQAAAEWLQTVLKDGPVAQVDVQERAKRDGITAKPLKIAKAKLKVQSVRRDYKWLWQLPFVGKLPAKDKKAEGQGVPEYLFRISMRDQFSRAPAAAHQPADEV